MRRTPLTTTPRRQRQSCVRIMMLLIRATAAGGYIASVRRDRRSANRIAAAPGLARPGPRSQAACPDHSCVILSNPEGRQAGRQASVDDRTQVRSMQSFFVRPARDAAAACTLRHCPAMRSHTPGGGGARRDNLFTFVID